MIIIMLGPFVDMRLVYFHIFIFQPAAKSSKSSAPAKPAGLAAAARGRGRAAASRAKDSIAADAVDDDEPEEKSATTAQEAAKEDKVRNAFCQQSGSAPRFLHSVSITLVD